MLPTFAEAKDLSTLQTALSLAHDDMEKAKNNHDTNAQAVAEQQRVVAEKKKQLAAETGQLGKMQQDTKQAWAQYIEAQRKYEKAHADLDAAWGKN